MDYPYLQHTLLIQHKGSGVMTDLWERRQFSCCHPEVTELMSFSVILFNSGEVCHIDNGKISCKIIKEASNRNNNN